MIIRQSRRYLMLSLLVGVLPVAACVGVEELPDDELAPEAVELAGAEDPEAEIETLELLAEQEPGAGCPNERVFSPIDEGLIDGSSQTLAGENSESYGSCPVDLYFHPNNGAHGGWIEAWRLCHRGGNNYQICRGGYAPVRYWNPSSCGGTVHDWYPQGWNGWAQTGGGCC